MAKIALIVFFITTLATAGTFQTTCVSCHSGKSGPDLEKIYLKYLSVHGSNERVKESMIDFLKAPSLEKSLLQVDVINTYGIHPTLPLDDGELGHLIDSYIKTYHIGNKIRMQ